MPYFTSWDVNTFLCLIYWGLPHDVVQRMMKMTKKTHEEFSLEEAKSYWIANSPTLVRVNKRGQEDIPGNLRFKYFVPKEWRLRGSVRVCRARDQNMIEFKTEWRLRSIEERKAKVIEWCKFGNEADQLRHQHRLKVYNPPVCRRYKYVKNLWQSWGAGASSYYFVGWDRRVNTSQWYEGIHPGRFFLFYRENEIVQERNRGVRVVWRGPCEDGYRYPQTPIFDKGPYEQLIEDLRCIDGPGLGESPGSKVEHIDDLFT